MSNKVQGWLIIAILIIVSAVAVFTMFDKMYFDNADGSVTYLKKNIFGSNSPKKA